MPEKIRILFVGEIHSSHAQSWIDLLSPHQDLFAIEAATVTNIIPSDCPYPVHFTAHPSIPRWRLDLRYARREIREQTQNTVAEVGAVYTYGDIFNQLQSVVALVRRFRPHIVHTFGFTPGALLWACVPEQLRQNIRWVLQTRGGSDVAFAHAQPTWQALFRSILPQADAVICDNTENFRIFSDLGIAVRRRDAISIAPGTGGMELPDVPLFVPLEQRNRLILWPKAYECEWSKALPVLEALKNVRDKLAPAQCILAATDQEMLQHISLLPKIVRDSLIVRGRMPRQEYLSLLQNARVVLLPSLVDGVPNALYEAMAAGCVPVVSPLATLTPHFSDPANVFYARNLYPDDIAAAILKAFDDNACAGMQERNFAKVRKMADRAVIRPKIVQLYQDLHTAPKL